MSNTKHALNVLGRKCSANRHRTLGFSLIEILVALLVLSIGLLGLAALQTFGLKYNQQSYQRTQAVFQAYDIVDRIRANRIARIAGCYDTLAEGATAIAAPAACVAAFVDCEAAECNTMQLANYDVRRWNETNAALLTNGAGAIVTAAGATRRTITIRWTENDIRQQFDLQVDL
jgi:type IV pilus assembly protein PilV